MLPDRRSRRTVGLRLAAVLAVPLAAPAALALQGQDFLQSHELQDREGRYDADLYDPWSAVAEDRAVVRWRTLYPEGSEYRPDLLQDEYALDPTGYDDWFYSPYGYEPGGYHYDPWYGETDYRGSTAFGADQGPYWTQGADGAWRRETGYHEREAGLPIRGGDIHSPQRDRDVSQRSWDGSQRSWRSTGTDTGTEREGRGGGRAASARASAAERTLEGRLESYQRVQLEGQRDPHTLVRLRLADGRTRIVNLGPRVTPAELGLRRDARVRLTGRPGRIGGESVLFATRVSVAGEATPVRAFRTRSTGSAGWSASAAGTGGTAEPRPSNAATEVLRGTVQRARRLRAVDEHVLVELELADGRTETVDLGARRVSLQPGDRIVLRGWRDWRHNRFVLRASALRVDGEPRLGG